MKEQFFVFRCRQRVTQPTRSGSKGKEWVRILAPTETLTYFLADHASAGNMDDGRREAKIRGLIWKP